MQQLKQRSLPGQVARSPIRERLSALAERYDKLTMLISEGRIGIPPAPAPLPSSPLGEKEQEAMQHLQRFASSLKASNVRVEYVAGGEVALAHAIVRHMATYADEESQRAERPELAEQESLAELELRHAGLNAYAALVVLAELQRGRASQTHDDGEGVGALVELVNMGDGQRMARFEGLLHGRRALRKIEEELRQARR